MTDNPLKHLLGSVDRDPGCDKAFEQLDEYCEAVRRGEDVASRYAEFVTHIGNCAACREDTEGLLAALERDAGSP
jgi:hypothetical protein